MTVNVNLWWQHTLLFCSGFHLLPVVLQNRSLESRQYMKMSWLQLGMWELGAVVLLPETVPSGSTSVVATLQVAVLSQLMSRFLLSHHPFLRPSLETSLWNLRLPKINAVVPTTWLVTTQWWSYFRIPSTWKSPSIREQTPVSSCAWTSVGRHPAQMPYSSPSGPRWWMGAPTQETTIRQNWSLSGKPQTCHFLLTTSTSAFPPSALWTRWQSRPSRDWCICTAVYPSASLLGHHPVWHPVLPDEEEALTFIFRTTRLAFLARVPWFYSKPFKTLEKSSTNTQGPLLTLKLCGWLAYLES